MRRKFTVIDLFSGGGGYARGFEDVGCSIIVAVDNYPPAVKTYKANFPHAIVLAEDIKELSYRDLREIAGITPGDVDVIIASPPCEPFTSANPRRMKDPLDRLYSDPVGVLFLHAIRLIGELKPEVFVIENVPGILDSPIPEAIRGEIVKFGYSEVFFNVLRAEERGTPSERVRVFVSNIELRPPKKQGSTVWEILEDLPPPGASHPPNHEYPQEIPRRHRARAISMRWGDALLYFTGANGGRHPNYIKLHPHRRAPAIMGSSRFIHPFEPRLLTVREQARLMGFPDYHIFLGSRDAQYDMVGEAVPPPLAKAIAEFIAEKLKG